MSFVYSLRNKYCIVVTVPIILELKSFLVGYFIVIRADIVGMHSTRPTPLIVSRMMRYVSNSNNCRQFWEERYIMDWRGAADVRFRLDFGFTHVLLKLANIIIRRCIPNIIQWPFV